MGWTSFTFSALSKRLYQILPCHGQDNPWPWQTRYHVSHTSIVRGVPKFCTAWHWVRRVYFFYGNLIKSFVSPREEVPLLYTSSELDHTSTDTRPRNYRISMIFCDELLTGWAKNISGSYQIGSREDARIAGKHTVFGRRCELARNGIAAFSERLLQHSSLDASYL